MKENHKKISRRRFLYLLAAAPGGGVTGMLYKKGYFNSPAAGEEGGRLPPGQRWVEELIEYSAGGRPPIDEQTWKFRIDGLVDKPRELTLEEFRHLPHVELKTDFHCVTTWSVKDAPWKGVRLAELLREAGVKPEAKFVFVECYGGYTTNFPLEVALRPDVLLADGYRGKPLPRMWGGPVRLTVPALYAYKSAKWVNRITLLAEDRRGFWEENGYSNRADPWKEQRRSGDDA